MRGNAELPDQLDFSFTVRGPSQNRLKVSLLHAAYLSLFRQYGYEYPFFAHTQWIRNILMSEADVKDVPFRLLRVSGGGMKMPEGRNVQETIFRTAHVWHDEKRRCLAVILPSPNRGEEARVVLMPGLGPDGAAQFESILKAELGHGSSLVTLDPATSPERRLADRDAKDFGLWLWNKRATRPAVPK